MEFIYNCKSDDVLQYDTYSIGNAQGTFDIIVEISLANGTLAKMVVGTFANFVDAMHKLEDVEDALFDAFGNKGNFVIFDDDDLDLLD